jgi:hypothetical protein
MLRFAETMLIQTAQTKTPVMHGLPYPSQPELALSTQLPAGDQHPV